MRSLIVDDDFVCRSALSAQLLRHGDCDVAADGREALAAFDRALEHGRPYQLICLDIDMPGMGGQEVLREVRRREAQRQPGPQAPVKVLMTSAHSEAGQVKTAFVNRSDGFLVKPVRGELLVARLRLLGLIPGG